MVKAQGSARKVSLAVLGLLLLALLLTWNPTGNRAVATHQPADKVAVAGSSIEVMSPQSAPVKLLEGTMKTSSPTDLIIEVTAECALWTATETVGNDSSEAFAQVKIYVTLDGKVIPVNGTEASDLATSRGLPVADAKADVGRVVFCNRAQRAVTSQFDDEDATTRLYLRTRSANAFNWITLNVGSSPRPHKIEVWGVLDTVLEGGLEAKAAVGKRTLVVFPAKLSNHAAI